MSISIDDIAHNDSFAPNAVIAHIAHWLLSQGPIKDFIHHNILHAVQDRLFRELLALAAKVFGAKRRSRCVIVFQWYHPIMDTRPMSLGPVSDFLGGWSVFRSRRRF